MNTLSIYTNYPDTVAKLLISEELIGNDHITGKLDFLLRVKHDLIGQSLSYWLVMATGCGLVTSYTLDRGGRA